MISLAMRNRHKQEDLRQKASDHRMAAAAQKNRKMSAPAPHPPPQRYIVDHHELARPRPPPVGMSSENGADPIQNFHRSQSNHQMLISKSYGELGMIPERRGSEIENGGEHMHETIKTRHTSSSSIEENHHQYSHRSTPRMTAVVAAAMASTKQREESPPAPPPSHTKPPLPPQAQSVRPQARPMHEPQKHPTHSTNPGNPGNPGNQGNPGYQQSRLSNRNEHQARQNLQPARQDGRRPSKSPAPVARQNPNPTTQQPARPPQQQKQQQKQQQNQHQQAMGGRRRAQQKK